MINDYKNNKAILEKKLTKQEEKLKNYEERILEFESEKMRAKSKEQAEVQKIPPKRPKYKINHKMGFLTGLEIVKQPEKDKESDELKKLHNKRSM